MKLKKVSFEELYPLILRTVQEGNEFSFLAFGHSMLPTIRNGLDLVTLGPVPETLKPYEIIFYRRESGQFVLHRIVRIRDGSFDLCGDNQYGVERGIKREQIIARLVALEREGKNIPAAAISGKVFCFFLPLRRFFLHLAAFFRAHFRRAGDET